MVGSRLLNVLMSGVSVNDALGRAVGSLREAGRLDDSLAPIRTLVEQALAELEEAGEQLGRYVRTLAPDPARLEIVERRLAELARLQKKYGGSPEHLIARRDEIARELTVASEGAEGMLTLINPEWAPILNGQTVDSSPVLVHGTVQGMHGDTSGDFPATHIRADVNHFVALDPADADRLATGNDDLLLHFEWEAGAYPA